MSTISAIPEPKQEATAAEAPASTPPFDVVVEAGRVEGRYWRDLFRYRELLLILAWRDVAVRYKQTVFGVAWVVGRPLLTVAVLTIVFGKLANLAAPGKTPYAVLVLAALLPWQLFSNSLTVSSISLVGNTSLISKVYFPRLIIPLSSLLAQLPDFFITALMLVPIMAYYGAMPVWQAVFLPPFILLALVCAAGCGLWLGALNVRFRDVGHAVPFLVQIGLYISPVGYSATLVPERWRLLYALNPLVGMIDGFRWCLIGPSADPYWPGVVLSAVISGLLLISGVWYFRRTERTFADLI
ncbi:MAG TPA: ABC transporter permease [Gemmataceae bacterium]|nr:ABC transporter permease [Gemmataceae bacterium]